MTKRANQNRMIYTPLFGYGKDNENDREIGHGRNIINPLMGNKADSET